MPLFTTSEVRSAAFAAAGTQSETLFESKASVLLANEAVKQASVTHFDIFLSHAYNDRTTVIGVYAILRSMGFSVYVDWIHDPKLSRTLVTPATAAVLRKRVRQSDSLMYATTQSSTNSKWMPWECGFFDGHDGHVAILPVVASTSSTYSGQEYLGLYPIAAKNSYSSGRNQLWIHNQNNMSISVYYDQWIRGQNP